MKQHIFKVEDSDIPHILSEFSISPDDVPQLVISALCGEKPQIFNPAFKAYLTDTLQVKFGDTRRFRRLEVALHRTFVNWLCQQ
jgi:hypothetical protein